MVGKKEIYQDVRFFHGALQLQNLRHNSETSLTKVQNVNDLMQHLIDVWAGVEHSVLTMPVTSGAGISMPAFDPQEDILNSHCDTN